MRLVALAVLLAAVPVRADKPSRAELESLLAKTDEIAAEVVKLRGLPLKRPLARGLMSRAEIEKRVLLLMDEEYEPGELVAEERTLKRFGLIPRDTDLRQLYVDLMVEQIAGFYDPGAKQLYLADWIPAVTQKVVIAHEVVHALQDQHFDLEKYAKLPRSQADALIARKSIAEGDGVALMVEYAMSQMDPKADPWADDRVVDMVSGMTGQTGLKVFENAPLVMKESLLFPYEGGLRFIARLRRTRPWGDVDKLFRDPPVSTEQILHPEKYDAREKPIAIKLPVLAAFKGWTRIYLGDQGELGVRILLRQHGIQKERAERAAAGWGGDQVQVFAPASDDGKSIDELVAIAPMAWDAEIDAVEAFRALSEALPSIGGGAVQVKETTRAVVADASGRQSLVVQKGTKVLLIVGAAPELMAKLEKEIMSRWK